MEFITLEDHTALYDATLFPEVYRRCSHLLSSNRAYVVQGLVEESFSVVTLTVLDLRWLESAADDSTPLCNHGMVTHATPCPVRRAHSFPLS